MFSLYQLNDEYSGFFMNSGQDANALIEAAKQLSKQYPGTNYAVKRGNDTIWSSKMPTAYRLIRKEGNISILLFPGEDPDLLIKMGMRATDKNPDWALEVQDADLHTIWSSKKSAPGKAEDTPHNG